MASFSMHLAIAKLYLDRHTEEDEYGCYGDNDDSEFEDEEFE